MNEARLLLLIVLLLLLVCAYLVLVINGQKRIASIKRRDHERILGINELAYQMIQIEIEGYPLRKRLQDMGIKTIVIYGMGELGERIMNDIILNTSMKLLYGMDRGAKDKNMIVPVYTLEDAKECEKPDLVLLTTYTKDKSLKELIEKEMETKVICLEEIIYA